MTETAAAVIVFETFLEQDGPQDAKTGDDGEKFRMSERQRVRGTAVDSWFCEARGNLVSNTVMLPFIQNFLAPTSLSRLSCISRFVNHVSRTYYLSSKIAKSTKMQFPVSAQKPPI